ncbi:ATP-dependent DNA helicase [Mycena indigotica]|uniref:ATP-dependent DNA helicase n=1 Tax=Mycena indigotica TaxID=2126181 RepID=A0A8H6SXJ3_9AGAR|nr:ATP-dependent DNA helicase [Mycena indigotica]KAF7307266.1 ATP-dependent DNA helicase [Mycena indigotica]
MGDDGAEGVAQNQPVDEYDEFFGDGSDMMDIDLPEDSAISAREAAAIAKMNAELAQLEIGRCSGCREEGFDVQLKTAMLCKRCDADHGEVKKWSTDNNTNPGPIPPELQNLTDLEEMLIARVKTVMQVRYTKGRQLCYKDHIVNLPQNITEIATKLPRLPEDVDIVIIRRDGVDLSQHVDYVVRREKVRKALEYKITHDKAYQDLELDEGALSQLPMNGSVVDRIPTCREGRQADGAPGPAGPNQAAGTDGGEEEGTFNGGIPNLDNVACREVEEIRRRCRTCCWTNLRADNCVLTT